MIRCWVNSTALKQESVADGAYIALKAKPLILEVSLEVFESVVAESIRNIRSEVNKLTEDMLIWIELENRLLLNEDSDRE